ncbi:MAG: heme-degrading domain-containing protein [Lacisediminihabitans sp.]
MTATTPDELRAQIAAIRDQEERLVFSRFSNEDAWRLGSILVELGQQRGLGIAINITRAEQQLFHAALAGTTADNDFWIAGKVRTVMRFGTSSFVLSLRRRLAESLSQSFPPLDESVYALAGGSFPIAIAAVGVVGTVTVSGLPQHDDHALVIEAIERFLAGE